MKERLLQENYGRITELLVLKEDGNQLPVSLRRLHHNVSNDTVLKFPKLYCQVVTLSYSPMAFESYGRSCKIRGQEYVLIILGVSILLASCYSLE